MTHADMARELLAQALDERQYQRWRPVFAFYAALHAVEHKARAIGQVGLRQALAFAQRFYVGADALHCVRDFLRFHSTHYT